MTFSRRVIMLVTLAITGLAAPLCAVADDAKDRAIQGEYVGTIGDGGRWGAQVIALGNGKFRGVGFMGGLPGDGWRRGDESRSSEGGWSGQQVVIDDGEVRVTIDGTKMVIRDGSGSTVGELKKVQRKSPTLGAKPPAGALVLFDGSSTQGWNKAEIVEIDGEKTLKATGCDTIEKFGDHELHVEFRTPFVPEKRGQERGNSGVYVQSRYEVQVLDSFGLSGEDNECGGIYSIQKPKVNMCFPPETWQTYDIDFKSARYDAEGKKTASARITVKHNGVVIHDNLELTKGTPGRFEEGKDLQGLFLQDHGNPVLFRNVWAVKH